MKNHIDIFIKVWMSFVLVFCFTFYSCGSGGGSDSGDGGGSGAILEGNVVSGSNLTVSIDELTVTTDSEGNFHIEDIPTGDKVVRFSNANMAAQTLEEVINAEYNLKGIEMNETFVLRDIEISQNQVVTEHTGTWTGTAGSTDSDSQGQIAFTMEIEANGNEITGTGMLVGSPDNSIWNVEGTETGIHIDGEFELVSSDSQCATGGTFTGTFSGNTIDADFSEVDPPEGCGDPEQGVFNLEKE